MQRVPAVLLLALGGCVGGEKGGSPRGPWDHLLSPGPGEFHQISSYDTTGGNRDRFEIAPGDSVVLLDVEGPGVIRRLWVTVASRDPDYLRRIALRMYWDDESAPSVAVPLGDFFGNGFAKIHYTALPMGASSGGFYCYLPMPFRKRARIVAENGTGSVVDAFYFNAGVETGEELPTPLATFHAAWSRDPRTTSSRPYTVLDAVGSGHLVGVSLNAEGYDDSYGFLEGDESFWVDGRFRGQGTGTEDYFNGGWYFQDGPFAAPYHGVVYMDPARGRVAAYRWHLPDPVRFRDSLRVELEHGHGNEAVADYATVAYWYQTEPHRPLPPLASPDLRRVLDVRIPAPAIPFDSLSWEEEGMGSWRVRLPVSRPDLYDIRVFWPGPDGRPAPPNTIRRRLPVRDTVVELEIQQFDPGLGREEDRPYGMDSALAANRPPVAVEATPVPRWATDWFVVGPFPNAQTVGTEYSPALDSVFPPQVDPDPRGEVPLMEGGVGGWRLISTDSTGYVRLNPYFRPNDWVAAYAQAFLYAPSRRAGTILLGADDAHQLWVNGHLVSSRQGRNVSVPDDLEIPVDLESGWNRILLKVADLDGGWGFHLRVADPGDELRWTTAPPSVIASGK